MDFARVTSKGQVTIPVAIREALGLEKGDYLIFEMPDDSEATLRVVKRRRLTDLHGVLPATRPFPGKEAIRREVARSLAGEEDQEEDG